MEVLGVGRVRARPQYGGEPAAGRLSHCPREQGFCGIEAFEVNALQVAPSRIPVGDRLLACWKARTAISVVVAIHAVKFARREMVSMKKDFGFGN